MDMCNVIPVVGTALLTFHSLPTKVALMPRPAVRRPPDRRGLDDSGSWALGRGPWAACGFWYCIFPLRVPLSLQ